MPTATLSITSSGGQSASMNLSAAMVAKVVQLHQEALAAGETTLQSPIKWLGSEINTKVIAPIRATIEIEETPEIAAKRAQIETLRLEIDAARAQLSEPDTTVV